MEYVSERTAGWRATRTPGIAVYSAEPNVWPFTIRAAFLTNQLTA